MAAGLTAALAAEPKTQGDDAELGAEYQKLLEMVKAQNKPVQSIDGDLDIAGRPGIGPKDAEVILVEFGDFQCPFCRRHLQGAAQEIRDKLVATGQVRYVFLDFPVEPKHPLAARAAAAARCAEEQGKYWEMRNTLYNNQKALNELFLVEHAKGAGLDADAFGSCLESGRYDAAVQQDKLVGQSLGIKGTPTFFLGINQGDRIILVRKIKGTQPYEVFEREILRAGEIAQKQRGMQGTGSRMGS
jgi:protein-disulfide isomerase